MGRKTWGLDYSDESGTSSAPRARAPASARRWLDVLSAPVGYPSNLPARDVGALRALYADVRVSAKVTDAEDAKAKMEAYQGAWQLAFSPARSLLTSAFAVLMTGSSVHLFSIMTGVTVLFMQLQALSAAPGVFANLVRESPQLRRRVLPQFFVYFALCAFGVAGALWQCQRLGFLPTTESDYTAFLPPISIDTFPNIAGGARV